MRYLSPGSLLGDALPQPLDKKGIQLARKKLFAELELTGSDHLEIHGAPFTKNDIIDYFEELQKDDIPVYHQAVAEDQVLLGFLEEGRLGRMDRFRQYDGYDSDPFIHWISPYFYSSFTAFAHSCFKDNDEDGLTTILRNRLMMTAYDLEQSWTFIRKILTNNISLLEYYQQQGKGSSKHEVTVEDVAPVMDYRCINMILLLPENRFGEIKDKYAFAMMQACIYTFNKDTSNRSYAKISLENARTLASSPDLQEQIGAKLQEMNTVKTKGKFFSVGRLVWIGLFIVVRLLSMNSNSSNSFQNAPIHFTTTIDTTKHPLNPHLDSIMQQLRSADNPTH
jgi:hypothetical protein